MLLPKGLSSSHKAFGESINFQTSTETSIQRLLTKDLIVSKSSLKRLDNLRKRLNKAIVVMNGMDSSKFPKFVSRIVEKFDQKEVQIFSEDEVDKLKTIFSIDDSRKIELVIKNIRYLLKQMIYNLAKPKILATELSDLGLESDKVIALVEIWNNNAPKIVDKLKEKSFETAPIELSDINWTVKVLTNQSCQSHQKLALAQLDLCLKSENQPLRNISLDFTHDELSQLYENIEAIQTQIDILQK